MATPTERVRVIANPGASEQFNAQVGLIRSSGAWYDRDRKAWFVHLPLGTPLAATLNPLFEAAARYGTSVAIEVLDRDADESSGHQG